jgi:hypothetical protein
MKVLLLLLISLNIYAHDSKKTYQDSIKSIAMIIHSGGICSGTLISKNEILTAAHCVDTLRTVFVKFQDQIDYYKGEVSKLNFEDDLAVIKIPIQTSRKHIKISIHEEQPGGQVVTIGHPTMFKGFSNKNVFHQDLMYLMSKGIISKNNENNYIIDASVSGGNSGGPLLNSKGELIGVISRKMIGLLVGDIGYAAKAKQINKLLNKQQVISYKDVTSDFGMGFSLTTHSFVSEYNRDNNTNIAHNRLSVEIYYRRYDRYIFNLAINSNSYMRNMHFYFGYKFEKLYSNKIPYHYIPFVGIKEFIQPNDSQDKDDDDSFSGLMLGIDVFPTGSGNGLRFAIENIDGGLHTNIGLLFGF